MRVNTVAVAKEHTHEGAVAAVINPEQQLRRSVMACMLWEDTFYEEGQSVADRIAALVDKVKFEKVAAIAVEAREKMKLRHAPLFLARALAKRKAGRQMGDLLEKLIQRPDELTEFLALYWKDGKKPLAKQVKVGLARAFRKFNEYQLAKYNRDDKVKLRDVLFLSHAKPKDDAQAALWKRLVDGKLVTPDTWEVALSAGEDKKAAFERLMAEKQLGALAFIRNLRNMQQAGVEKATVAAYANTVDLGRVLPFRFVAAAKAAASWEDVCDGMLLRCTSQLPKIPGKTVIVVDVSGSMYSAGNISKNSDMTRVEAAGALAAIIRETCEDPRLYATAGNDSTRVHATAECPPRRGMALVEVFNKQGFAAKLGGGGIFLVQCLEWIKAREKDADRLIVLTDEQDCDRKLQPMTADAFGKSNYLINVATYKNGIGYGRWTHIDGWSEAIVEYIRAADSQ